MKTIRLEAFAFPVALTFAGLSLTPAIGQASVITWGPAQNTVDANDVVTGGAVVEARNGIPQVGYLVDEPTMDTTVAGILFDATNFLGKDFLTEPINSMLSGTSTGDAAYDLLIGNATVCDGTILGNGSTDTSANYVIAGLSVGTSYKVQIWYCDVRVNYDGRLMILDGSVTIQSGLYNNPGDFGQYAVGTFTADATTQMINVDSNGTAGRSHITAILVREESSYVAYCLGDLGSGIPCPCGNDNDGSVPGSGCANGSFASGAQLTGSGTASLGADTLVLATTGLDPSNSGLYFQANNDLSPGIIWGDGLQCAGGQLKRLGVRFSDAGGNSDTSAWATPISVKAGNVMAGDTKYYQCWYRDTSGAQPCGVGVNDFNASNGLAVTWKP